MVIYAIGTTFIFFPTASSQSISDIPPSLSNVSSAPTISIGIADEEFIGPFASWLNVKDACGAKGDGVADDTAAIQRGLDLLRKFDGHDGPGVLFFPTGTYRITQTLQMRLTGGANLVGADPTTTVIVWDGDVDGIMLRASGSSDTLFTRLTWNGKHKASIGIAQWWNFTLDRANYQGGVKHIDEIFRDLGIGIYGGRLGKDYGQGDSETLIKRVKFIENTRAGINVGSFNALNWWIWDSEFRNCARGVSNEFSMDDKGPAAGAGNFAVYRNLFFHSSVADITFGNTGWFAFRANVSIGSARFLLAHEIGANSAAIIVQQNRIIDTKNPEAIRVGNEGPLILLDNSIRSLPNASGPVVKMFGSGLSEKNNDRDLFSMGNHYTVPKPIEIAGHGGRLLSLDDARVDRGSIDSAPPVMPDVAPDFHRKVFEVPVGANAEQIQKIIDAAAASDSDNAVVHLPAGDYRIERTLVVPPRTRIQIAGDSEASRLWWAGPKPAGTIIYLAGPTQATVRDLRLFGAKATAIDADKADQAGGLVFIEGSSLSSLRVTGLAHTRVDAQANGGISSLSADGSLSVVSVGCGGLGPVRISAGSNVLVSESWYEGTRADLFRADVGNFTYLGGLMAPYNHGIQGGQSPTSPAILIDKLAGHASFIGLQLALLDARNGIEVVPSSDPTVTLFFGVTAFFDRSAEKRDFFHGSLTRSGVRMILSKIYVAPIGAANVPDVGRNDAQFVSDAFRQSRSIRWETHRPVHQSGATDLRLFRVNSVDTAVGLDIHR